MRCLWLVGKQMGRVGVDAAWLAAFAVMLCFVCFANGCGKQSDANHQSDASKPAPALTLFAAASTGQAAEDLAKAYEQATGQAVQVHTASSGRLAKQILAGAQADVVLLANPLWMDQLDQAALLAPATRQNFLSNHLTLICPRKPQGPHAAGSVVALETSAMGETLADPALQTPPEAWVTWLQTNTRSALEAARDTNPASAPALRGFRGLVLGDPGAVPVGMYAKQALMHLGMWEPVSDRVVAAANATMAARWVAMGQADWGIVYASDALAFKDRVAVVWVLPASAHDPIVYPVAVLKDAKPGAEALQAFLMGPTGRKLFEARGFACP